MGFPWGSMRAKGGAQALSQGLVVLDLVVGLGGEAGRTARVGRHSKGAASGKRGGRPLPKLPRPPRPAHHPHRPFHYSPGKPRSRTTGSNGRPLTAPLERLSTLTSEPFCGTGLHAVATVPTYHHARSICLLRVVDTLPWPSAVPLDSLLLATSCDGWA